MVRARTIASAELRHLPLIFEHGRNFTSFRVSSCVVDAARGWAQIKNPRVSRAPARGHVENEIVDLVPVNDGDGFVHVMMGAINVRNHAIPQAARFGIIFFLLDIVVSMVQKLAGIMQTSDPGLVRINGRALFDILAVVECGALDFINGVVNLFNGGALFSMQSAAVGPLQMRARIAQIGKRAQVGWMLALCVGVLRREREQEGDRRSDHSNSSKCSHSDYHLVWDWDGFRRDGTAALPYNPVEHAPAAFVVRQREAVSRKTTRGAGLRWRDRGCHPL
jgi:hypothetical protein